MIELEREDRNDVSVIHFATIVGESGNGDLDFKNTVCLRKELYDLVDKGRNKIILNMEKIVKNSSYCMGFFVAFAKNIRESGGDIKFINLSDRVKQTFEATRIDHILEVFESDEESALDKAIAAFK